MKSKITKIWGVGLVLVLVGALILAAAPVSAQPPPPKDLEWAPYPLPGPKPFHTLSGDMVVDMAVAYDGTIYAATGADTLESEGLGTAEWSTDEAYTGGTSAKLYAPGSGDDFGDYGKVILPLEMAFEDLVDFSFYVEGGTSVQDLPLHEIELSEITEAIDVDGSSTEPATIPADAKRINIAYQPGDEGITTDGDDATWQKFGTHGDAVPSTSGDTAGSAGGYWAIFWDSTDDGVLDSSSYYFTWTEIHNAFNNKATIQDVRVELRWPPADSTVYVDGITINDTTYDLPPVPPSKLYKSTDGGGKWSSLKLDGVAGVVAVAPDDADLVVVGDTINNEVYYSDDGGRNFYNLRINGDNVTEIHDIAISPTTAGKRYVAVGGDDTAGAGGEIRISYFDLSNLLGGWTDIDDAGDKPDGKTTCKALAFSPAFPSDFAMVAVTETDDVDDIRFEIYSYNVHNWNDGGPFTSYDGEANKIVTSGGGLSPLDSATIDLAPTYYGGDEMERVAFVSLATADSEGGVYRMNDATATPLKFGIPFRSADYEESGKLVAGEYGKNMVWRADGALTAKTGSLTKYTSRYQKPGGMEKTIAAWAGDNVVAATQGDESSFAVSKDDGETFNDVSLINTNLTNLEDIYVSPDAKTLYLLTDDGGDLSFWCQAGPAWERLLSLQGDSGYIVRVGLDDVANIYLAKPGLNDILYSTDSGETQWKMRVCSGSGFDDIADIAVESAGVVYALDGDGDVSKTESAGFIWGTAKSTGLDHGATIALLSEGNLLVGGAADGGVAYSTDGNASWDEVDGAPDAGPVHVAATGLSTGDYIFAAGGTEIYAGEVGEDMEEISPDDSALTVTGIGLSGGVLYATACDSVNSNSTCYRSLNPTAKDVEWSTMAADDKAFNTTPSALRITTGSVKLWAIDTVGAGFPPGPKVYTYNDILTDISPKPTAPDSGSTVPMNVASGQAHDVAFNWSRLDKATAYEFELALDADFTQTLLQRYDDPEAAPNNIASSKDIVVFIVGPNSASEGALTDSFTYMPGTTYYWRVRVAKDYPLYSPWSPVQSFTVEELAPEALIPAIAAPANGATGVSLMPAFSWTPVAGAERYEFQLASDILFTPMSTVISTMAGKAGIDPITTPLDYGTKYLWRVRVVHPVEGQWSALANFTTMAAPVPPPPPPEPAPPVVVEQTPVPVIDIELPTPQVTVEVPAPNQITVPSPQTIVLPPEQATAPIDPGYLLAIIIIGAVLVIAVIVLVVRTRRPV